VTLAEWYFSVTAGVTLMTGQMQVLFNQQVDINSGKNKHHFGPVI